MSQLVEVLVPDIGNFDSVDVIEVLVNIGDTIAEEEALITLESDKASMDIPSSHAGVVKEIKVSVGDQVKQGSVILLVEADATATAEQAPAAASEAPAKAAPAPTEAPKTETPE